MFNLELQNSNTKGNYVEKFMRRNLLTLSTFVAAF